MNRSSSFAKTFLVSAGLALLAASASAQMQMPMHGHGPHDAMATVDQNDPSALSAGEIKKVDKDTGKLTIQHGPLNNLDMPGMTMAFKVQDPAMLDQVKTGDKIQFRVERVNGTLTVTKLATAK
jgi:Cu(I)/Ag(I) efflux system periplasmic protein CusF